jgi:hypothetical protein
MKGFGPSSSGKAPMKTDAQKNVHRIFVDEGHLIDEALNQGVREAMLRHKKDGLPVVIERDGKIEWVRPEDLGY